MPDLSATIPLRITGYIAGCAVPIELYGPHADRTEEFGKSVGVDIMKACRDEARHWFRYNAT